MPNRFIARALTVGTVLATGPMFVGLAAGPASAAPPRPLFGAAIEDDAAYQPQTMCISSAQPGLVKFRSMVLAAYSGTGDSGITRPCSDGGRSEHKEGRAWDWTVSINNSHQVSQAGDLFNWLFATDYFGHKNAMARRLGIMYIIWNKRIWHAYDGRWAPYSCSGTTGCHQNHVHFSFDWAGALAKTSYWTRNVAGFVNPPVGLLDDQTLPTSMTVDSRVREGVLTPFTMTRGHRYKLTATGTYAYRDGTDGPMVADAECTLHDSGVWLRQSIFEGSPGHNQFDVWAFGHAIWVANHDNGHGCSTDHRYTEYITMPLTERLPLRIDDWRYADNHGSLDVTISKA